MIEVLTVNALSTIALLMAIAILDPFKRWIQVFLDNARYHHADMAKQWLAREGMPDQTAFHPDLLSPSIRLSDYGG